MKKIFAILLSLILICSLSACKKNEANLVHKTYMGKIIELGEDYLVIDCSTTNDAEKFLLNENTSKISFNLMVGQKVLVESEYYTNDEKPYTAILVSLDDKEDPNDQSKLYTYNVAFANWTDNHQIYADALNWKTIAISSVRHLPVYKFDTKEELDSFKSEFKDILTMDQGYDEVPSFEYIMAAYDDRFFSKYSLMLSYVRANSGSYRYGVSDVYCEDKAFCMYIEQLNNPEVYTTDMAGWFVVVEVDKEDIANCDTFDAQLGKK